MNRIELPANVRKEIGKGPSRRLRANKMIPAVLYGRHTAQPIGLSVDPIALKRAIATPKKLNTILTLKLDDGSERTVLLKDYQTDIVRHDVVHADFLEVRLDEKVLVKVPLAFQGLAIGVTEGGILQTLRRELVVSVLPDAIPEKIEVDISGMKIGSSLHVKDVKVPEGVEPKFQTNFTICAVVAPEREEAGPGAGAEAAAAAAAGAAAAPAASAGAAPAAAAAAAATPKKEAGKK